MRVPKGVLITLGVLPAVAIFALLVWALIHDNGENPGGLIVFGSTGEVKINQRQAPVFSLTQFDGSQFRSDTLRGKLVMVDFWASWCPPCRAEAKGLETVWRKYKERGVVFVGVDLWDPDKDSAAAFLKQSGTSYTVGVDLKGGLAVDFGVTGIPEKYFISPQGGIIRKFIGPMDEARLSALLDELLEKVSAPAAS